MQMAKDKGKKVVKEDVPPEKKKMTKAEKQAYRAEMVAKAAAEAAAGRAPPLRIRDPTSRQSEAQGGGTEQQPLRRSTRATGPKTRGGLTSPPPAKRQKKEAAPKVPREPRRAREDREAEEAIRAMDTRVRVPEGMALKDYTQFDAEKVKRYRYHLDFEMWHPGQRTPGLDPRFWTLRQASFYESYRRRGHQIFPHRFLEWPSLERAAGTDVRRHFEAFPGLADLVVARRNRYVEDWVRVFYSTLYVGGEREGLHFMFGGRPYFLPRERLAEWLGLEWIEVSLHEAVYGDADPPRRALVGGVAPTWEEIRPLFVEGQTPDHPRVPSLLTPEA